MPYTPENNPYIPGDPYSYDLKWIVQQLKSAGDIKKYAEESKINADRAEAAALSAVNKYIVVDDILTLQNIDLDPGQYAATLGFNSADDNGGALYVIIEDDPLIIIDNIEYFRGRNNLIIQRVFSDRTSLESLNASANAWSDIAAIISAHNIKYVYCDVYTMNDSIEIDGFNFEFNELTYTANDWAIIIDSQSEKRIKGNILTASAGSGIKITTSTDHCNRNVIEINYINADVNGIDILPIRSKGIMWGFYHFQGITAGNTGLNIYIGTGTGYYSWEGEETYEIGNIIASVGVSMICEPDASDMSDGGTITGLNFLNLAVEGSTTGIYMLCGGTIYTGNMWSGIKSISVNNFRTREWGKTTKFLDGSGLIRQSNIYATSKINVNQFTFTNPGTDDFVVHGRVAARRSYFDDQGDDLIFSNGFTYVGKRLPASDTVSANPYTYDLSDLNTSYYIPDIIIVASSNNNAVINLDYMYHESAGGILVSVGPNRNATFNFIDSQTVTINNTDSSRHVYPLSLIKFSNTGTGKVSVADLGAYSW